MKIRKEISAQSVIEYLVIITAIMALLLSSGIVERMKGVFEGYFNQAVERLS